MQLSVIVWECNWLYRFKCFFFVPTEDCNHCAWGISPTTLP